MIAETLERAGMERGCNAGIYIGKTVNAFANEIGEWAEGENEIGPWIATVPSDLAIAFRFLLILNRLASARDKRRVVDVAGVLAQLERVRTSLKRVATMKKNVSSIHDGADKIQDESEQLQAEVKSALLAVEEALRVPEINLT